VAGVVGAVKGEAAQGGELGLHVVEPTRLPVSLRCWSVTGGDSDHGLHPDHRSQLTRLGAADDQPRGSWVRPGAVHP
jgi:hypothetical protein